MCGIAGLMSSRAPVESQHIAGMIAPLEPRGPDGAGIWVADDGGIGLGHRRLSILDLSEAGRQPMESVCGRYVLTFNGEIYNFAALRDRLEGEGTAPPWKGHSDTEVLLAAIAAWGLRSALERAEGMFALGLWDREQRTLSLARDRFGEKPLYYGWTPAGFAFASTLAPIAGLPGFERSIELQALSVLLARAYVPAPLSIYRGVFKLEPGCLLVVPESGDRHCPAKAPEPGQSGPVRVERWFDYAEVVLAGAADPIVDEAEALDLLEKALAGAVSRQLVADVPVGTFLSGGIDSSLVTVLAQRQSGRAVRSFTIGFTEAGFDEAVHARKVAAAIGTDHTELYVTPEEVREVIPRLPAMYDEPFADSSQIPTHLVSRLARTEVTVALSGDAGDELFGGYTRHVQIPWLWRWRERIPGPLRQPLLRTAGGIPASAWQVMARAAGRSPSPQFGHRTRHALRMVAGSQRFDALLDSFLDDWALRPDPLAEKVHRQARLALDPRLAALPRETALMHVDTVSYLPGDILTKLDRAAMATGLETRVPFLDPTVAGVAARMSPQLRFGEGGGKHILKQLLYSHVPAGLFDRPKAGFAIPVGPWLRGPLRSWAEDLLAPQALARSGLFDVAVIRERWSRHLSGREDATQPLWAVLMFQAWHS